VSRFLENAAKLLDAAECGLRAGHVPSDMTILIGAGGGIHMIASSDWPLDSLQAHHGAAMAYRVSHDRDAVRVEGRSGASKCLIESPKPDQVARLLLGACSPSSYVLNAIRNTDPTPAELSA